MNKATQNPSNFTHPNLNKAVNEVEYYENGNKKSETIKFGMVILSYIRWGEDGKTLEENHYNDKGQRHGKWCFYYENGQKKNEFYFKNDFKEGLETRWHETGEKKSETFWNKGKVDGDFYEWNVSGVLVEERHYINKIPDGHWFTNHPHNYTEQNYSNGKKNGVFIDGFSTKNYKNGKLHGYFRDGYYGNAKEGNYKNGRKEGEWTEVDAGKLFVKEYYKNGKNDGLRTVYNKETNTPSWEVTYKEGKCHGASRHYDKEGNVTHEIYYENEKEVKKPKLAIVTSKWEKCLEDMIENATRDKEYLKFEREFVGLEVMELTLDELLDVKEKVIKSNNEEEADRLVEELFYDTANWKEFSIEDREITSHWRYRR
jgi:antitoxin component YwqK of YwqJK toxin-antitoxin module